MKNPPWIREELILALDLYFKLDYGQMHGRNPEVIDLSISLRRLNLIKVIPNVSNFRSVNSVALKLANFKKFDQNFSGSGMKSGAKHDREIWNEFHKHLNTLKNEADLIRQLYLNYKSGKHKSSEEPKAGYKSEFLFQLHKNKETDPLALKIKKETVLAESKLLKCEVCGFDSNAFYGELGNDIMEIHFIKDWENEPKLEGSELKDFIIVCRNCHKILDNNFGLLNPKDIKKMIKKR